MSLPHIIKSKQFDEQLMVISKGYPRFDELDSAIDWAIERFSRKPNVFFELPKKNGFYLWKTDKIANFPQLRIVFKYIKKENTFELLNIEEIVTK